MRILLAEDEPVSRRLIQANLVKWGFEVVLAADGAQAWRLLQGDDAPRLALLDWMMPGVDGVEVCRQIRQRAAEPYVYIVLLTAKGRQQDILQGLAAGADDYVTKPFDPHELEVRLRTGRRILQLQADLIAAREALRVQATHDPLTGLWNRRAILDLAHRELTRATREGRPLTALMLDIDHFKQVNDRHGHEVGDTVLCQTAERMSACLRPYDLLGRYGGEEFLVLLPGCDAETAGSLAERLRACVANHPVLTPDGPGVPVTVSVGVATAGAAGTDVERLIAAADDALYRAKWRGRNRVEVGQAAARPKYGPVLKPTAGALPRGC